MKQLDIQSLLSNLQYKDFMVHELYIENLSEIVSPLIKSLDNISYQEDNSSKSYPNIWIPFEGNTDKEIIDFKLKEPNGYDTVKEIEEDWEFISYKFKRKVYWHCCNFTIYKNGNYHELTFSFNNFILKCDIEKNFVMVDVSLQKEEVKVLEKGEKHIVLDFLNYAIPKFISEYEKLGSKKIGYYEDLNLAVDWRWRWGTISLKDYNSFCEDTGLYSGYKSDFISEVDNNLFLENSSNFEQTPLKGYLLSKELYIDAVNIAYESIDRRCTDNKEKNYINNCHGGATVLTEIDNGYDAFKEWYLKNEWSGHHVFEIVFGSSDTFLSLKPELLKDGTFYLHLHVGSSLRNYERVIKIAMAFNNNGIPFKLSGTNKYKDFINGKTLVGVSPVDTYIRRSYNFPINYNEEIGLCVSASELEEWENMSKDFIRVYPLTN